MPVVFHGVIGQDMREGNSPSFFNPAEVALVDDYLKRLIEYGIKPRDIGIIAPYRKQVRRVSETMGEIL